MRRKRSKIHYGADMINEKDSFAIIEKDL